MANARNTINSLPGDEAEPVTVEQPRVKTKSSSGKVKSILEGSFLVREKVIRQLPFLIFLTCIGLLYIFNSNYANRSIISISRTKKQIEEQRFEYINTKSKLMHTTRQTEIAKRLQTSGLKESKTPPRKIRIEEAAQ
jgi:hypothetical protein